MLENKVINFVKTREVNDHGVNKKILDLHITGGIISITDQNAVKEILRELQPKIDSGYTPKECMDYLRWYLMEFYGM